MIDYIKKMEQQQIEALNQFKRDMRDAQRWRKLIELCGHLQDGSQTTVQLYQDDATRTAFVTVSPKSSHRKDYFIDGCGFDAAIDSVPEKELD